MFALGPIGFTAPWLLLGLIALPILWILLRAVPPAPIRRRFPGVALLLGLVDDETQTDKTPWWLLLLRMLAVAAVIIGFAGPVLNPQETRAGSGPVMIVIDGSWPQAPDWDDRIARVDALLAEAARNGRTVAIEQITDPDGGAIAFLAADAWRGRLAGWQPAAWQPSIAEDAAFAARVADIDAFETWWLSDGIARDGRADLLAALEAKGSVTVFESPRPAYALRPLRFEDGAVAVEVLRARLGSSATLRLDALGRDPAGVERVLDSVTVTFETDALEATAALVVPAEIRNRITRMEIAGIRSAGAVTLADDGLKRREVALIAGREDREGLELLSPLHYLYQALVPTADLIDGAMTDILLANPDVIILADVAQVSEPADVLTWVQDGGLLVRFAGPRLAASDVGRESEDPLMPVRLRAGGRSVGGAMSWGEPKALRPFEAESPFFGLTVPDDVVVSAQVMAQPDPTLASRVVAALSDGTPLVTRKSEGKGQIILFHVTANAEWSSLPLSGLFVEMLERLSVSTRPAVPDVEDLQGTTWVAQDILDGFGRIEDAGNLGGIAGEDLVAAMPGPDVPPGLYAGEDRRIALNVLDADRQLAPVVWPARIPVEGIDVQPERPLKGVFLAVALGLLLVDILASLWLSGRLRGPRGAVAGAMIALASGAGVPADVAAQESREDAFALASTSEVVLAHVLTGDPRLDEVAAAGLLGISETLRRRTSIEPADPFAINLETDELSFFPFLYWPISVQQPTPSAEAYAKLNRYLRGGGMILFDTRDSDTARFGAGSPTGRKLQELARPLDIPPLEPIPGDHVLTRTFYLLQDFPGRHNSRDVWVEAAPPDAEQIEGMPFRNLNDGVTPVVIGGNDWASAWAIDSRGNRMFQVGRGYSGERQREIALRFGVNLIMHVLTGNYKSDQVHVPALLDRLGQ